MRSHLLRGLLAASLLSSPALAQVTPAPAPAAAPATVSTEDFRRLALMAEYFDFESSRLAVERSGRRSIQRYADTLMQSFRADYARLAAGASSFAGVPALPTDPNAPPTSFVDQRRAAMLNQLAGATGREFDNLYLDMQVGMRQEVLGLYETYARSTGDDAALLAFARERLPALAEEFRVAQRLARRR